MSQWFPGPSAAEERAEALRKLVPAQPETGWRHYGLLLRAVFTVLAAIAVAACFGFFALLELPPKGVLTAALAIGTSEWLIRKHRFFRTGVESSLWLCGTFAFIFGLPSQGKVEALLVFAAAAALSGWRMRNAFFGVFAAILVIVYIGIKWDHTPLPAVFAASLIAIAAAVAMRRLWQRPSTEWLFAGLALAMPVAGYVSTIALRIFKPAFPMNPAVAAILGITALILLIAGIAWRDRVLLVSAVFSVACAAVELRDLVDVSAEGKLIATGALLIAIAVALSRALHNATHGFVIIPMRSAAYDDAMQIRGIIDDAAPHRAHAVHTDKPADSAEATSGY